jgi:hypothetical protein
MLSIALHSFVSCSVYFMVFSVHICHSLDKLLLSIMILVAIVNKIVILISFGEFAVDV